MCSLSFVCCHLKDKEAGSVDCGIHKRLDTPGIAEVGYFVYIYLFRDIAVGCLFLAPEQLNR